MRKKILALLCCTIALISCGCSKEYKRPFELENMSINDNTYNPLDEPANSMEDQQKQLKDMLCLYETDRGQQLYTMGTLHGKYWEQEYNYSVADLLHTVELINPDYVLIEARPEILQDYDVVDGPPEMLLLYAYCKSNNIPVIGIDYWEEDNQILDNIGKTYEERDNKMFYNIYDATREIKKNATILVCYGGSHYYYEIPRMEIAGWKPKTIENIDKLHEPAGDGFTYPSELINVLNKGIQYYIINYPTYLEDKISDPQVCNTMQVKIESTIKELQKLRELVKNNELYLYS